MVGVLLLVVQVVVVVLGKMVLHVGRGTTAGAAMVHVHEVRLAVLGVVVLVVVQNGGQVGDGRRVGVWVGMWVGVRRQGAGRGHRHRDTGLPLRCGHGTSVGLVLNGALWRVGLAAGSAPSTLTSATVPLVLSALTIPSASPRNPRPPAPFPSGPASPALSRRLLLVDQATDGAALRPAGGADIMNRAWLREHFYHNSFSMCPLNNLIRPAKLEEVLK